MSSIFSFCVIPVSVLSSVFRNNMIFFQYNRNCHSSQHFSILILRLGRNSALPLGESCRFFVHRYEFLRILHNFVKYSGKPPLEYGTLINNNKLRLRWVDRAFHGAYFLARKRPLFLFPFCRTTDNLFMKELALRMNKPTGSIYQLYGRVPLS